MCPSKHTDVSTTVLECFRCLEASNQARDNFVAVYIGRYGAVGPAIIHLTAT